MAFSNLSSDVSLQQFSELWESSRYAQGMSVDPDGLRQMLEKSEKQLPDISLSEMPNAKGMEEMEIGRAADTVAEAFEASKSLKDLQVDDEDKFLHAKLCTPSWLSDAVLSHQANPPGTEGRKELPAKWCEACGADCICASMQKSSPSSPPSHVYTDWLSAVPIGTNHPEEAGVELSDGQPMTTGPSCTPGRTVNQMSDHSRGREHHRVNLGLHTDGESSGGPRLENASNIGGQRAAERNTNEERLKNWQEARLKSKVLAHPMFPQMLAAHVGCLRIATPVDQLHQIDDQLAQSQLVIDKYSVFMPAEGEDVDDKEELDNFMRNYTNVLMDLQTRLQHHVRVHATEAMMGCWEIEQKLYALTGVVPGPGTGATMSDDEEEEQVAESFAESYETGMDVQDTGGFGPLVPTETERSLMERVRQELKLELTEKGYREKILDVREEILRKRRAGKLPEGTTPVLKAWWNAHSKWPYPTEDEKERLIQETGLELKQVNNWFINQRKRNWHSNPLSSSSNDLKNKRKV